MFITMTERQTQSVAEFLNAKYDDWSRVQKRAGCRSSISAFAEELGIGQPTMSRYMKLGPDRTPIEHMDGAIFLILFDRWGAEFIEAFREDVRAASSAREPA